MAPSTGNKRLEFSTCALQLPVNATKEMPCTSNKWQRRTGRSLSLVDGEEDEVGVLGGVAEGEDLVVDLLEGVLVDDARRAVLLESAVQPTHLPYESIEDDVIMF